MTMTQDEITHLVNTVPRHHIIGVRGFIRIQTPKNGWDDEVLWPPQMCTSAGLTWRLEPLPGLAADTFGVLAYEIVEDPVTGSHDLIVHTEPGDKHT